MKHVKLILVATGLLGLAACFLPVVRDSGTTFWGLHRLDGGQVVGVMLGYLVAGAMGALALLRPPLQTWQAGCALAAYAFVIAKLWQMLDGVLSALALGGVVMGAAALAGLGVAALGLFGRDQAAATS